MDALKIWHGGLGVWGAIALGVLGAYLVARRQARSASRPCSTPWPPASLVAQAIGRLGNWFNQELFGRPTTLPWGLEIEPRVPAGRLRAVRHLPPDLPVRAAVEPRPSRSCWSGLDRKFRLGHGKVFALYVVLYTAGRFWIEALRIDTVNEIGGFRLNNYTSLIVFVAALIWFIWLVRNRPGREEVVEGRRSPLSRWNRRRLRRPRSPPTSSDKLDRRRVIGHRGGVGPRRSTKDDF